MKNMTKNKDKIYTLIALAVIIGFLVFLRSDTTKYSYQVSILRGSTIYAVMAVSMNLLAGFTGLFSLGQAGFMVIGIYVMAVLTIPAGFRVDVYYVSDISSVTANIQLPIPVALPLGGLAAAAMVALIEIPVLRLRSDCFAIATLDFPEVIRAFIAAPMFNTITNSSCGLKSIPGFPNIFAAFVLAALCIALMVLLINSSYGRAFKSIREDEVVVQSIGINLFHYKELSFVISSFFTGVRSEMLAMFIQSIDSKTFQVALIYDILLIVILGGIGNVTGSTAGASLVTADRKPPCFFDEPLTTTGISIPLLRSGSCMVIFPILLMAMVLFYRHSIIRDNESS